MQVVNRISFVAVGIRALAYLFAILSFVAKFESFNRWLVISRGLSILWHFLIALLCYKFPTKLYKWFALLVIPSFITNFYFTADIGDIIGSMVGSYAFSLILSILLSTSWLLTSLAMLLSSLIISIFAIIELQLYTLTFHSILAAFSGLSIFACYSSEKSEKIQVL